MSGRAFPASVAFLALLLVGSGAKADVLTLLPSRISVMPQEDDGWARVALKFDLPSVESGEANGVVWAYLEWQVEGNSMGETEFYAFPISSDWSPEVRGSSSGIITREVDPVADWLLSSEVEDKIGPIIRLDLRYLAADWTVGVRENYGIVVASPNLTNEALQAQLANARLVVGFGFIEY